MFPQSQKWLFRTGLILLLTCPARPAQTQLPPDVADHATGYIEWLLDVHFTSDQQQHCRRMLEERWNTNQNAGHTITTMARAEGELSGLPGSERDKLLPDQQRRFLTELENRTDENSRWLLSLYRDAHPQAQGSREAAAAPFIGKWTDGHISSIQYKNAYTGVSAPTNGRSFTYEFRPDGTYSFTGLMQNVVYNCTSAVFSHETGTWAANGETIALTPQSNPYQMTNNCAPSSNHESPGKLINRTYRIRVTAENGRRYLELQGDGGLMRFGESR